MHGRFFLAALVYRWRLLFNRLLKNAHLLRCAHLASLRRTKQYASFRMISRALHLSIFEQPVRNDFFNNLLKQIAGKLGKHGAFAFFKIDMGGELLALHFFNQIAQAV